MSMDTTATRRFEETNVDWPGDPFFIPVGGLSVFLAQNLRFKVFIVATAVFTDAFAANRDELRRQMRDIVRHMFFAAQIRQNEFRVEYSPAPVSPASAWMFHVILVLLVVVGFNGEDTAVKYTTGPTVATEGQVAQAQASFLLGAALSTYISRKKSGEVPGEESHLEYDGYDLSRAISANFAYRSRPSTFSRVPTDDRMADAFQYNEVIADWQERSAIIKRGEHYPGGACAHAGHTPGVDYSHCGHSVASSESSLSSECRESAEVAARVCGIMAAAHAAHRVIRGLPSRRPFKRSTPLGPVTYEAFNNQFLVKPDKSLESEDSSGSLPELQSVSNSSDSESM
ncbi:hypothetical protein C8R47DRAFT_1231137 [Mycena vitilis]|nr:hypothetical protein C8R47DRAFT_1231137 [Mycena vitilis]